MMDELADLDATGLAELVRKREVSPRELVDAAIARIERINPRLNAVVTSTFDRAREEAEKGAPTGPFAGVPFLAKDLTAVAGTRLTFGSSLLESFVPPFDSVTVERYRRAGLLFLGKTNTSEFGLLPTTEPRLFGPCKNPWDSARTAGGSSGGSAAAVAARLVPAAHGNDAGGSLRIPASCCGVFGLKPTRARASSGPALGDWMNGMVVDHAISRSVRDSAALLDVIAGYADGDPYVAPAPARPYVEEARTPPGRLRVALTVESPFGGGVHEACASAARGAARLCAELGHEVVEVTPSIEAEPLLEMLTVITSAGAGASLDLWAHVLQRSVSASEFEPFTWALAERGRAQSASRYLVAVSYVQRFARAMARFHQEHDVWLTPTLAELPPLLGDIDGSSGDALSTFARVVRFAPFTRLANATGQPAMSVPLHWTEEGLPIGVQFTARYGDEATLFRLAAQLEEARPWAHRAPPVAMARA